MSGPISLTSHQLWRMAGEPIVYSLWNTARQREYYQGHRGHPPQTLDDLRTFMWQPGVEAMYVRWLESKVLGGLETK